MQSHSFPIPKIADMNRSMEGFTFTSALDLNMGYYHIKLDDVQKLWTVELPKEKYKYTCLLMVIKISRIEGSHQVR
jgi:hypothetical protein